jgi:hypothetical protein
MFRPAQVLGALGLVVTEFNADRDKDGNLTRRLVEALGKILVDAHPSWNK